MINHHHHDDATASPVVIGEHTVYVAFDVTATTRADALRFRDDQDNDTTAGRILAEHNVESWWLIEEDAKTYDHNDNQPGCVTFH